MRCPRTAEIDWAAYQADPTSDEWAEVRAHYPICTDCSREVARYAELRFRLAEAEPPAHPSEQELLAFDRSRADLTAMRQAEIERHVEDCRPCRNELSVLETMMPVGVMSEASQESTDPQRRGLFAWLTDLLSSPPALAAVSAAAVAIIGLYMAFSTGDRPDTGQTPRLAEETADETQAPSPAAELSAPIEPAEELLAEESAPTPARSDEPAPVMPSPTPPSAEPEADTELFAERPGSKPLPGTASDAAGAESERPEPSRDFERGGEMLLASLDLPMMAPDYDPAANLMGAGLAPSRIDVMIRAGGSDAVIRVLAPEHTAITFERSPRLYWHLSKTSDLSIELILVEQATDEVVFIQTLTPPVRGGLHRLDLAEEKISLAPETTYLFFASIVADPERRDLDLTSGITLESRPDSTPTAGAPGERVAELARTGSWIDAFATLQGWIDREPELARASDHRAALLEQVRRSDVAAALSEVEPEESALP